MFIDNLYNRFSATFNWQWWLTNASRELVAAWEAYELRKITTAHGRTAFSGTDGIYYTMTHQISKAFYTQATSNLPSVVLPFSGFTIKERT